MIYKKKIMNQKYNINHKNYRKKRNDNIISAPIGAWK